MQGGIVSCGAYVPMLRLPRALIAAANDWMNPALAQARGERSICNWDEDALTMAVEAGRECLRGAQRPAARLQLASTTLPFADRSNAGLVAAALDLDETGLATECGGSLRSATSALLAALEAGGQPDTLLIASDHRRARPGSSAEMRYGDAAAALALGQGDALIAQFLGGATVNRDLVDHHRASGQTYDYGFEERWVRDEGYLKLLPEVIGRALTSAGVSAAQIDTLVFPGPARMGKALCRRLQLPDECLADDLSAQCGDSGSAHPLLMLVKVLESARPGQLIMLLGFGQGADALVFRVTANIERQPRRASVSTCLARRREETRYVRYLSFAGEVQMDWGARAEHDKRTAQSTFHRKRRAITAFVGGHCSACGTPQFPRTRMCVHCGALDTQREHRFAESPARVKSYTEDWQAHSPAPPLMYGSVSFAEGGSLLMEFTDFAPGELAVDTPLRMMFRIKDIDDRRGFIRYFWKPTKAMDAQ